MKPSDEELNRAAAEACGWRPSPTLGHWEWTDTDSETWEPCWIDPADNTVCLCPPAFCADRNALPELWAVLDTAVESKKKIEEYMEILVDPGYHYSTPWKDVWDCLNMPPRKHVIAALKALGRWQEEWTEEI